MRILESIDGTAWRSKMNQDIAQPVMELYFAGIDFDESCEEEKGDDSDQEDPINMKGFSHSVFVFSITKRLFKRSIRVRISVRKNRTMCLSRRYPVLKERKSISGYTRIYDFAGFQDSWVQSGGDLGYRGTGNRFGHSVSISNSIIRATIGAHDSMVDNRTPGEVFVCQLLSDQSWNPFGSSLVGDADEDEFGYSVALSPEGDHLAIEFPEHHATGLARVFLYDRGDDCLPSQDILPRVEDATFGLAVDFSSFAERVAVGLPLVNEARVLLD